MKIDLGLAAMILNPMVCACLIGGILLKLDVFALPIAIGVVGYGTWGVLHYHQLQTPEGSSRASCSKKITPTAKIELAF